MISDVMLEAIEDIERYQEWAAYQGLSTEIETVKTVMRALMTWLDCPPTGMYPKYDAAKTRLRSAIASLNVEGLLSALENLKASWPTPEEIEAATG
jgi:hypothetical protein